MSNLIKAYAVRYDDRSKKFIEPHIKGIINEQKIPKGIRQEGISLQEGFINGIEAASLNAAREENDNKLIAEKVTADAKKEAERIIEQAKKEASLIKDEAFAQAQKKGFDEGMQKARQEARRLEEEYNKKMQQLQDERENIMNELQPQIAELIAGLVEKITGILVEDKKEVILYLVEKAIKKLDKFNELNIKVSSEDYEYLTENKGLLQQAIDRDVEIHIAEDSSLLKNQCIIETDTRMIDCSLNVQLDNLITDLKLIGGI